MKTDEEYFNKLYPQCILSEEDKSVIRNTLHYNCFKVCSSLRELRDCLIDVLIGGRNEQ